MNDWDQAIDIEESDIGDFETTQVLIGDGVLIKGEPLSHKLPKTSLFETLKQFDSIRDTILCVTPEGNITFHNIHGQKGFWLCKIDLDGE